MPDFSPPRLSPIRRFFSSDFLRPLVTARHRHYLAGELFGHLGRARRFGQSLDGVLLQVEKDSLRLRWHDRLFPVAIFLPILFLFLPFVGNELGQWGRLYLFLFGGLCIIGLLAKGRLWHDGYLGVMARNLRLSMLQGRTLGEAMERHKVFFDPEEVVLVRVGEQTDLLAPALERLARQKRTLVDFLPYTSTLIYLCVLAAVYLVVAAFVGTVILPKFVDVFQQLGFELPWLSRKVFGLVGTLDGGTGVILGSLLGQIGVLLVILLFPFSGSRTGFWLLVLGPLWGILVGSLLSLPAVLESLGSDQLPPAAVVLVGAAAVAVPLFNSLIIVFLLRIVLRRGLGIVTPLFEDIPGINRFFLHRALERFLFSLGCLLQGRVPMAEAISLAGQAAGARPVRKMAERVRRRIEQGGSLSDGLDAEALVPMRIRRLIRLSEASETLPERCCEMAEWQYEDARHFQVRFMSIFAPAAHAVLGVAALFLIVALYLPIFEMPRAVMRLQDETPVRKQQPEPARPRLEALSPGGMPSAGPEPASPAAPPTKMPGTMPSGMPSGMPGGMPSPLPTPGSTPLSREEMRALREALRPGVPAVPVATPGAVPAGGNR